MNKIQYGQNLEEIYIKPNLRQNEIIDTNSSKKSLNEQNLNRPHEIDFK